MGWVKIILKAKLGKNESFCYLISVFLVFFTRYKKEQIGWISVKKCPFFHLVAAGCPQKI